MHIIIETIYNRINQYWYKSLICCKTESQRSCVYNIFWQVIPCINDPYKERIFVAVWNGNFYIELVIVIGSSSITLNIQVIEDVFRVCIAWYKHERGEQNSRQIYKTKRRSRGFNFSFGLLVFNFKLLIFVLKFLLFIKYMYYWLFYFFCKLLSFVWKNQERNQK